MEDSTSGDDEDIYADVTEARLEAGLETARSTSTAPQQATTVKNALQAQGGASHLNAITLAPTPAATHAPPPSATSAPAASSAPSAVYIANLAWYTTDAEVEDLCRPFGPQNCHIVADKRSGRSKGYAVVDFADSEAAASAKVSSSPSLTCAIIKGFSMLPTCRTGYAAASLMEMKLSCFLLRQHRSGFLKEAPRGRQSQGSMQSQASQLQPRQPHM